MEVFVVRLWTPSGETTDTSEPVRGTALHVPSGQTVVFSDPAALLEFLATRAAQAREPALAAEIHGPPGSVGDP